MNGENCRLNSDVLFFFEKKPGALKLYDAFERRVLAQIDDVRIKVQKTQISFFNAHMFACVSFAPVRKAKDRPESYMVVTFGLGYRKASPRIDVATQPNPSRWTHHVMITQMEEIDDALMAWIVEAAAFSAR